MNYFINIWIMEFFASILFNNSKLFSCFCWEASFLNKLFNYFMNHSLIEGCKLGIAPKSKCMEWVSMGISKILKVIECFWMCHLRNIAHRPNECWPHRTLSWPFSHRSFQISKNERELS